MRVAVEKMEGVTEAVVSLNDGQVTISLADDNGVTLESIREAVRNQGFTPREADVRLRGVPRLLEHALAVEVAGTDVVYEVLGDAPVLEALRDRAGERVVVEGRVEEATPERLRIMSIKEPAAASSQRVSGLNAGGAR